MAETSGHNKQSYPSWSIIQYEFAATDKRPAVKMTWYDGGKRPPLELLEGAEINESGSLLIGEKGKLYSPGSDGNTMKLLGGARKRMSRSANRQGISKNSWRQSKGASRQCRTSPTTPGR